MANIEKFTGFGEASALPPNSFICVIRSDRLSHDKQNVNGQRGVAYKIKNDPDNVYVIGNGFYWRGPRSEVTSFYESKLEGDPLTIKVTFDYAGGYINSGGYLINQHVAKVIEQTLQGGNHKPWTYSSSKSDHEKGP